MSKMLPDREFRAHLDTSELGGPAFFLPTPYLNSVAASGSGEGEKPVALLIPARNG